MSAQVEITKDEIASAKRLLVVLNEALLTVVDMPVGLRRDAAATMKLLRKIEAAAS